MKYDIENSMREIEKRSVGIRKKRRAAVISGLSAASASLCIMLCAAITFFAGSASAGMVSIQYGAMMLNETAGGYVVTSVIAFASSCALTLAAAYKRRK